MLLFKMNEKKKGSKFLEKEDKIESQHHSPVLVVAPGKIKDVEEPPRSICFWEN